MSKDNKANFMGRPEPIQSGAPLEYKVKVQHRSDILMQEQIENVHNIQEGLQGALAEMEKARSAEEIQFHKSHVDELKAHAEQMVIVLKIISKINTELAYARLELQKALKTGGDANTARKRVGWLEDRMEMLLGKRRQRSPARAQIGSDAYGTPRFMAGYSGDGLQSQPFTPTDTLTLPTRGLPVYSPGESDTVGTEESALTELTADNTHKGKERRSKMQGKMKVRMSPQPTTDDASEKRIILKDKIKEESEIERRDAEDEAESQTSAVNPPSPDNTESKESEEDRDEGEEREGDTDDGEEDEEDEGSRDDEDEEEQSNVFMTEGSVAPSHPSRMSRVTIKSPPTTSVDEKSVIEEKVSQDAAEEYWTSEHHRFQLGEHADALIENNPLTYHQMGLAVPGTFVEENNLTSGIPWTEGEDTIDIHMTALHKLSTRLATMQEKVKEAALLSVRHDHKDGPANPINLLLSAKKKINTKPSMSRVLGAGNRPDSSTSVSFPPLDKERLGSSLSGRLVYHPKPLPYPPHLPLTQTNYDEEFPKGPEDFSQSKPGISTPAERIVNQRNLLNETKFTSSLYHCKPVRSKETTDNLPEIAVTPAKEEKIKTDLKSTFQAAKVMVKFKAHGENKWKMMKPKSGALEHSGLKWERVRSIVHNNLNSTYTEERIDGARHLGALKCGDTMVTYALKQRLQMDDEVRVRYESAKSLVMLGCWEEEVLAALVQFLIDGNKDMRADLLRTMSRGKNVQYVDKRLPSFPELAKILSVLCLNNDPEDSISLDSSVCLGRLCVADNNAKNKLKQLLRENKDHHIRAKAMEILVRQLNCNDWSLVEAILHNLRTSPAWKQRRDAARLLIYLGKRYVCLPSKSDSVFSLLETLLHDDVNKEVRLEVATAMAALDMYAKTCERAEKKLEDQNEEVRAQAVISLGTLNVKNDRIVRTLVEMLQLDSSEYVRLMILRTFAHLKVSDKRVVRAVRDKERGEGPLSREAKKTLEAMGIKPTASMNKVAKLAKTNTMVLQAMISGIK